MVRLPSDTAGSQAGVSLPRPSRFPISVPSSWCCLRAPWRLRCALIPPFPSGALAALFPFDLCPGGLAPAPASYGLCSLASRWACHDGMGATRSQSESSRGKGRDIWLPSPLYQAVWLAAFHTQAPAGWASSHSHSPGSPSCPLHVWDGNWPWCSITSH